MIRVIGTAVKSHTLGSIATLFVAYLCLVTFRYFHKFPENNNARHLLVTSRILASIVILGKACDLIDHHQESKKSGASSPQKTSIVTAPEVASSVQKEATTAASSSMDTEDLEVEVMTSAFTKQRYEEQPHHKPSCSSFDSMSSEAAAGLLEAKLQLLQTAAIRSTPPVHVLTSKLSEDNLDPIEEEKPLTTTSAIGGQHIWSNRRSQLLKQHQGELNRVVFSDSRRRPLSCTPPSTSISTSVSIDEPEDETFSSSVSTRENMSFMAAGSQDDPAVNNSEAIEATDEEENAASLSPSMKAKSLSSPDFMKSLKAAYDEERDWPEIDDDEVDGDEDEDGGHGGEADLGERRGSSEMRRRKRLDSSVV